MKKTIVGIICCLSILNAARSQDNYKAVRTLTVPIIDGILDESCWTSQSPFTSFESFIPDFGKTIPQETRAWIAYDSENLYFAFDCRDDEPERIKATMAARDQIRTDDWICINLDTHNDQQAITAIYVNPLGIQMDTKFAASKEDPSIDLVWYSAGKLQPSGYTIEIAVPLKSLRFSDKDPVIMGMFLERYVSRTSTHVSYPVLDPAQGYAFFNQTMKVEFEGVKHYTLFEALPAMTYLHRDIRQGSDLVRDLRKPEASLTLKYGLTSNFIIDATLNPDFSQVESDAGQVDVNLRYANFYPEKRPFFLEGQEKFNIGATSLSDIDPLVTLVHTRTMANPLTGLKMTGKIGKDNDLAMIYTLDEYAENENSDRSFAHFPVVRYKRNFANESYLGLLYTGRESALASNRVYGLDGQFRINPSTMVELSGFNTHTRDTLAARSGHSLGLSLNHDSRNLGYILSARDIARDYEVYTGYVKRTGISQLSALLSPKLYPDSKLLRKITMEFFGSVSHDQFHSMWETYNHVSALAILGGTTQFKAKYVYANEVFQAKRFNTGGAHFLLSTQYRSWLSAAVLYRHTNAIYYSANPFQGKLDRLTCQLELQPWAKLNGTLDFIYYAFRRTENRQLEYNYPITRLKLSYQFNKYLFIRAIGEYNGYYQKLLSDFLVSFTYIPGTVFYFGYGSLYQQEDENIPFLSRSQAPLEMQRGLFIKLSYLYRR